MLINLTQPFTQADVAALLASAQDTGVQLYVTTAGLAGIRSRNIDLLPGELFRTDSWAAGTGYVGLAASQDEEWVERIYQMLLANWPTPSAPYVDSY